MGAEGFFHDAHEVYARPTDSDPWQWQGTMATEDLADDMAATLAKDHNLQTDVRPV